MFRFVKVDLDTDKKVKSLYNECVPKLNELNVLFEKNLEIISTLEENVISEIDKISENTKIDIQKLKEKLYKDVDLEIAEIKKIHFDKSLIEYHRNELDSLKKNEKLTEMEKIKCYEEKIKNIEREIKRNYTVKFKPANLNLYFHSKTISVNSYQKADKFIIDKILEGNYKKYEINHGQIQDAYLLPNNKLLTFEHTKKYSSTIEWMCLYDINKLNFNRITKKAIIDSFYTAAINNENIYVLNRYSYEISVYNFDLDLLRSLKINKNDFKITEQDEKTYRLLYFISNMCFYEGYLYICDQYNSAVLKYSIGVDNCNLVKEYNFKHRIGCMAIANDTLALTSYEIGEDIDGDSFRQLCFYVYDISKKLTLLGKNSCQGVHFDSDTISAFHSFFVIDSKYINVVEQDGNFTGKLHMNILDKVLTKQQKVFYNEESIIFVSLETRDIFIL